MFLAHITSLFGDWFNTLAVLALLRSIGEDDARSFGWILIFKFLPGLFVAPLAGTLVDRFSRKGILITMDLLRGLVVLALILLESLRELGLPGVPLLYGLIVLQASAQAIAEPARTSVLPDLVRKQDLVTANAMGAAAWSLMFTVGTALGGLVTAWLGWQTALGIDLLTYLVSASLLIGLVVPSHHVPGVKVRAPFLDGLRFLMARPRLWTLALCKSGWSLAGAITLVLTVLGERVYPVGGKAILGVTLLYMARGLGTGVGPIVSRWICGADPARSERIIGWAYLWACGLYVVLGQVDHLALAILLVVLAHLGGATVWVFSTVRLQASVPTEVRGRVFATEQAVWRMTGAASIYVFGLAIDQEWASLDTVTSGIGALLLLPAVLWWLRGWLLGDP